jgi:hypothetical protein
VNSEELGFKRANLGRSMKGHCKLY